MHMFSCSAPRYIQKWPGIVSPNAVALKQEDLFFLCSSFCLEPKLHWEVGCFSWVLECKKSSLGFLGLGSWQEWSDRDFNGKKYGRKFWDLGGSGKEETEFRWLTARCRKGAWEATRDLPVWQSDGKTLWEAYNFGYADKEKEEIKILKTVAG